MSWQNRLKPDIELRSPYGNAFWALWRDNDRSVEKKLGIFDPPGFEGSLVQDLGSKAVTYPLTIYFEGIFHNKEAEEFFKACKTEVGQWEVIHPTKGSLILQLVSCTEKISPVSVGNYTEFDTQWIEPANVERMKSAENSLLEMISEIFALIDDAMLVLAQLRADIYSAVASAINMLNKIAGFADKFLSEIAITNALIQEMFESAKAAFNDAISNFGVDDPDTEPVAEAMIDLITSPIEASTNFNQSYEQYLDMIDKTIEEIPTDTTDDDYNKIVSQEFSIVAMLIGIAQLVTVTEFSSRAEIVSAMENLTYVLNYVVESLDNVQDNFSGLDIDKQYFSQTQTYTRLVNVYSIAMNYLISQFFNLKTENRIVLKTARSPLEIAITEYGELGENDYYYDLFLTSNNLSSNDILILPAGREVVIYGK